MDIHRMIRKGSVQFEPGDRIPITFINKGKELTLFLGSVYFDNSQYKVCYDLFSQDNSVNPVTSLQPRDIEKLSAGDLLEVANRLDEYERVSILRYSNYKAIENAIECSETKTIYFEGVSQPRVLVNPDSRILDTSASFEECRVKSVFLGDNDCYVSVLSENGKEKNVKLAMFNDRSIMNITSCLKSQQIQNIISDKAKERVIPVVKL